MPIRLVLLRSHHAWRSFHDNSFALFHCSFQFRLSLCRPMKTPVFPSQLPLVSRIQHDAPLLRISLCPIQAPLNPRQEIVVVVNSSGSGKIGTFQIACRIANPITLRPFLVAFGTKQGASACEAPGAAVFRGGVVAVGC